MTDTTGANAHDRLDDFDRVYLEKLRLAAEVILELAADNAIPDPLEAELYVFRDRIHRALLLPAAGGLPPWRQSASGPRTPDPADPSTV